LKTELLAFRGRDCTTTASVHLIVEAVPCRRRLVELAEAVLLEFPLLVEVGVAVEYSYPALEPIGLLGVPSV
jgi:hypothetical protein